MKISRLMRTEVVTIQVDEPILHAVELTASERIRHLPVLEGDKLVGMVSILDICRAMPSPLVAGSEPEYHKVLRETPVKRIMRSRPVTAGPDASLGDVVRLMAENKVGAVPIVEGKRVVGIVSELDLLKVFHKVLSAIE